MNKKKVIFLSTFVLFISILIITGTFAFFNWQSNNNKGLSFNVASNLKNYIEYDNGDSTFIGDFQVSNSFTDGIHSTISIKKKQEAASIAMVATINMDINAIGPNMARSSALKWVVTSGNSSSVGPVLSQGNFIGSKSGDTLMLLPNIEVTTSVKEYTIWIWLDINEHPSDALSGETLDTAVWTQIEQLAGMEEIYEITKISANYQRLSATVINNKNVITKYAITTSNNTPDSWTDIDTNLQNNIYNLEYNTSATGTYYIWFMDSASSITSSSISVTNIDTTAPSCTFGEFSVTPIRNNETSQITLTCIDTESTIENYNLTIDNLITSSSVVNITNVRKEQVTNGYKYTITVTGTETDGSANITLPANTIRNSMNLGNAITTSTASITVRNIIDLSSASITLNPNSFTYDGTAKEPTITVTLDGDTLTRNTDYSASFANNINVGTATVYITGINDYEGSTSATFTITKATCSAPTNVSISTAGVVTWTGVSTALSYEISIDNTNYTAVSSGVNYKSTITASTGNRIVYVRSVCNSDNYNTPSTAASTSISVYTVTLTSGAGISAVTGASNYIAGETVSIDAIVKNGYTFSNWTSGGSQVSTIKAYSAVITSDWNYMANATGNIYTGTFYYNGNATAGSTTISSATASCQVANDNNTCIITIPEVVRNSMGTWNNTYVGLSTSVGNMTEAISSASTTITVSTDNNYYSLYRTNVIIYRPNSEYLTSCGAETVYRNQWFSSNASMANTVISSTSTGIINNISPYILSGWTFSKLTTEAASSGTSYAVAANIAGTINTSFYVTETQNVNATFYYYNGSSQASTTASGTRTLHCTNTTTAATVNNGIVVPSAASSNRSPNIYMGVSNATNSSVTMSPNVGTQTYYSTYRNNVSASFTSSTGVTSIGSSSASCVKYFLTNGTTYSDRACQITLPSITSTYTVRGWYNGDTLIGQPNTTTTITSNVTYTAKVLVATDFSYSNSRTGVNCSDISCMIDYLATH